MSSENPTRRPRFTPRLHGLEERDTPAQFGIPWGDPTHLTLSFVPDGTPVIGTATSDLTAKLDSALGRAAWQVAVLRAVQTWSELANVNVGLVADGGQPLGTTGPAQGDGRFGDIRVGGVPMAPSELAAAIPPDPFTSGTLAGDVFVNTGAAFTADSLYAVALHEVGHALGLAPSTDPRSVMNNTLGVNLAPSAQDVAAIRALYGTRAPDANEGDKGNNTTRTATRVRPLQGDSGGDDLSLPMAAYGDITTRSDVDVFWFEAPGKYRGPTTVRVQTAGVSLLNARLTVTDGRGRVLGSATGSALGGDVLSVTLPGLADGVKYYVRVEAAPGGAFGVGRYGLGVTFDNLARPTAMSLDQVLRGPYETLDRDELGELFRDPAEALYGDDYHDDDEAGDATRLRSTPGFATNTHYETVASLADGTDVDFYQVRSPENRTPAVLTATVRGVGPNAVAPRVEVLDDDLNRIPARILANGNGTFTVQAVGLEGAGDRYYVKVFDQTRASGNYALEVSFHTAATAFSPFASGSLAGPSAETGYTLYVGRTELFAFALSASGPVGSGSVLMTVRRAGDLADAPPVFQLLAPAGNTTTGLSALLAPGEYRVTFAAVPGPSPTALSLGFQLVGSWLSDPVGPVASDPTLAPQYQAPQDPNRFLYPDGTLTFDPFQWVYLYSL